MLDFIPYPYQLEAIKFITVRKRCALFMEMGLGKTAISLYVISQLLSLGLVKKVLVLAPFRVILTTWPKETVKWGFLFKCSTVIGDKEKRLECLSTEADMYLMNYENTRWLVEQYETNETVSNWPFDMVVADESTRLKSHRSVTFKQLKTILPFTKRWLNLTGTPAPNGLAGLWSQTYCLDFGARLGENITAFRTRWFYPSAGYYTFTAHRHSEQEINTRLKPICLSVKAKGNVDLPPMVYNNVTVVLSNKIRALYLDMVKDFVAEFERGTVEAVNAAVKSGKLIQICNGNVYNENGDCVHVHKEKLDALKSIVEESGGNPIFLAYNYLTDKELILRTFPQAVQIGKNPATIDDWNCGKISMLIAHPKSAGHGLNLQEGGHIIVWYGVTWDLELYQQFNARLMRLGQNSPVFVHHIVVENSIDMAILDRLASKATLQDALMRFLQSSREQF